MYWDNKSTLCALHWFERKKKKKGEKNFLGVTQTDLYFTEEGNKDTLP
jgi:hypothetical protein